MRYSALRQIDQANGERLKPAWTFRAGKAGSEAVPLVVERVMYVTAPGRLYARWFRRPASCSGSMMPTAWSARPGVLQGGGGLHPASSWAMDISCGARCDHRQGPRRFATRAASI